MPVRESSCSGCAGAGQSSRKRPTTSRRSSEAARVSAVRGERRQGCTRPRWRRRLHRESPHHLAAAGKRRSARIGRRPRAHFCLTWVGTDACTGSDFAACSTRRADRGASHRSPAVWPCHVEPLRRLRRFVLIDSMITAAVWTRARVRATARSAPDKEPAASAASQASRLGAW